MGGGNEVEETPQQRASAEFANASFTDFKQRWLPLQKRLAAQIQVAGRPNSAEERMAEGKSSTDTAIQFSKASQEAEKRLTKSGVGIGSGKFNSAMSGLEDDTATSKGTGLSIADQQVDDAYVQGLSALTAIGRGERATVGNSLMNQAQQSGRQAANDAETALEERAGYAEMGGQVVGMGLQQGMKGLSTPTPQYNYMDDASGTNYSQNSAAVMGRR